MRLLPAHPRSAALIGFALLLPLIVLNAIVGNRIEPWFSMLRPGSGSSTREYVVLVLALLLLPIGAWVALAPMIRNRRESGLRIHPFNAVVAGLLLALFAVISTAFAADIYRCDVLQIVNCD